MTAICDTERAFTTLHNFLDLRTYLAHLHTLIFLGCQITARRNDENEDFLMLPDAVI
jgi:hypothetical protein